MRALFEPYIWEGNILVMYAGISAKLLRGLEIAEPNAVRHAGQAVLSKSMLNGWFADMSEDSPYWWIGRARGGRDPIGGPLWCDWDAEFTPIPGLLQIVGHTHNKHGLIVWKNDDAVCVDTLGHDIGKRGETLLELRDTRYVDVTTVEVKTHGIK